MYYKLIITVLIITGLASCKGDMVNLTGPSGPAGQGGTNGLNGMNGDKGSIQAPFGTWKMVSYEDDKVTPYDISIEFKNEKNELGQYIINGKSIVNFYFAYFTADFPKRTITMYGVGGTKIKGPAAEIYYEEAYWLRLSKVEKYEVTNNGQTLILYLPEKEKQKITYKLIK